MDLCKSQTLTPLVTQHHCFILLLHYCSSKRRGPELETLQKTSWTIEGWRHAFFAPPSICRSSESDLYKRNQKGGLSAVQSAAFGKFETVFRYPQPFTNTCKPPQKSKNDVSSLAMHFKVSRCFKTFLMHRGSRQLEPLFPKWKSILDQSAHQNP